MKDRALAALVGGALGDAMGMPTQLLSHQQIAARYGNVETFVAPNDDHPVSRGLEAGTITDDTEQTLLVGNVLLQSDGGFDHTRWIDSLVAWEDDIRARGGYDLLGPSTKRAIEAIKNGLSPEEAGRHGDTNGAAMRIAPVGIMVPPSERLIHTGAETCRATHNTSIAISAAAAVATVVSHGIDGLSWREAVSKAVDAAREAETEGAWVAGGRLSSRITWALDMAGRVANTSDVRALFDVLGTSVASQESVPAAFATLTLAKGDCWSAAVIAANVGGDTDTIGAISCTMAGACSGMASLPAEKISGLRGFDIAIARDMADRLVDLRVASRHHAGG
jgi:ADP-ribosylglycohydrolase